MKALVVMAGAALLSLPQTGCHRGPVGQWMAPDAASPDAAASDAQVKDRRGPADARPADRPAGDGPWLTAEAARRACVIASSCAVGPPTVGTTWPIFAAGACLDSLAGLGFYASPVEEVSDPILARRLVACATSSDCAAFQKCFGGNLVTLSRCRMGGLCQGTRLTLDAKGQPYLDCAAWGAACQDLYSGAQRACCNTKACSGSNKVTCAGDRGEFCHFWGAHLPFDCSLTGRTCNADPQALCAGKGAGCAAGGPTSCKGSVATFCAGQKLASHDCAKTLFRTGCAAGSPYAVCAPRYKECEPRNFVGACQGTQLVICADGKKQLVDCKQLGFGACDLPAAGHARCIKYP